MSEAIGRPGSDWRKIGVGTAALASGRAWAGRGGVPGGSEPSSIEGRRADGEPPAPVG
jgi:hypothetical protein